MLGLDLSLLCVVSSCRFVLLAAAAAAADHCGGFGVSYSGFNMSTYCGDYLPGFPGPSGMEPATTQYPCNAISLHGDIPTWQQQ